MNEKFLGVCLTGGPSRLTATKRPVGVLTLGSRPGVSSLCLTRVTLCADRENSVPSWGRWEWYNAL